MNHYYLEQRSKEIGKELRAQGIMSQAYYSSRPASEGLFLRFRRLIQNYLKVRADKRAPAAEKIQPEAVYLEP